METEIVLFVRERVPDAVLHAALADAFGIAPHAADKPLVVRYAQGFAVGISVPCDGSVPVERAVEVLSKRLDTAVLLESRGEAQWLLFAPGASHPLEVQVVELRHGLDVLMPMPVVAAAANAVHA